MKKIILSSEAIQDIISMYKSGVPIKDITRKHKIKNPNFLYKLLKEHDVIFSPRGGHNEIISKIDIEKVKELYNSGMTQAQLAKEFKVVSSTICNLMKLHNIPTRKRGEKA